MRTIYTHGLHGSCIGILKQMLNTKESTSVFLLTNILHFEIFVVTLYAHNAYDRYGSNYTNEQVHYSL